MTSYKAFHVVKTYIKCRRWVSRAHNRLHRPHSASSAGNKAFFRKLLDLPNEILAEILSWLDNHHLICVSGLSRRFNEVSLRLYFERKGIPTKDIASGEYVLGSSEAIYGLRRAFFVESIRSFSCGFRDWYVMEDMWELEWLLKRSLISHELSLNFRQDLFEVADSDPIAFFTTNDLLESLRNVMYVSTRRRETVVVLTGNKLGGVFTCPPADILRWDLIWRKFVRRRTRFERFLARIKSGLRLEARTPYEALLRMYFDPPETCHSISFLEEMRIQHISSQSFANWSLITFNSNSIDHLSLTVDLSSEVWASILPYVYLPALKCIEISCSTGIFAVDLEAFLCRHPTISFAILKSVILPPDSQPILHDVLPSISWISSTPSYLARILTSAQAFPQLTDVSIVPSMVYEGPHVDTTSTIDPFTDIFRSLAGRTNELHVAFDPHSIPSSDELIRCLTTRPTTVDAGDTLQCIVSIAINEFRKEAADHLPRWLSYFPALHDINLSDRFLASFKRERELVQYINLIHEACPGVLINPDGAF